MDDLAIVLDDQTLPDDLHGTTTAFQLVVSPTGDRIDELVMPCQTADPAHTVLHQLPTWTASTTGAPCTSTRATTRPCSSLVSHMQW